MIEPACFILTRGNNGQSWRPQRRNLQVNRRFCNYNQNSGLSFCQYGSSRENGHSIILVVLLLMHRYWFKGYISSLFCVVIYIAAVETRHHLLIMSKFHVEQWDSKLFGYVEVTICHVWRVYDERAWDEVIQKTLRGTPCRWSVPTLQMWETSRGT